MLDTEPNRKRSKLIRGVREKLTNNCRPVVGMIWKRVDALMIAFEFRVWIFVSILCRVLCTCVFALKWPDTSRVCFYPDTQRGDYRRIYDDRETDTATHSQSKHRAFSIFHFGRMISALRARKQFQHLRNVIIVSC